MFFVLVLLSFISCTAKKGFVTGMPKQEIEDVQRFPILSDIFALDKNDYGFLCDSLSTLSAKCIDSYLDKQNNIAFYNNSKFEGRPSRQHNIDRQFMELYYRYWR